MLLEARSDDLPIICDRQFSATAAILTAERQDSILLLEGVNDSAVEMMIAAGYSSIERLPKALGGDALAKP